MKRLALVLGLLFVFLSLPVPAGSRQDYSFYVDLTGLSSGQAAYSQPVRVSGTGSTSCMAYATAGYDGTNSAVTWYGSMTCDPKYESCSAIGVMSVDPATLTAWNTSGQGFGTIVPSQWTWVKNGQMAYNPCPRWQIIRATCGTGPCTVGGVWVFCSTSK